MRGPRLLVAVPNGLFLFQSLLLSVDDGTGARLYREYPHSLTELLLVRRSFEKGEEEIVNHVFFKGGYVDRPGGDAQDGLLFPRKGKYSVTVLYVHGGAVSMMASNTLQLEVDEPNGSDRQVLEAVRRNPDLLRARGSADDRSYIRTALEEHPRSPYLRWAKLERSRHKASDLQSDRDPDTGDSVYHLGKEGLAEFRRQHYRRLAEDILSDEDWGPFEEEALAMASLYAHGAGDKEMSERARKDLFERYPRSATVKRIKEAEARPADIEDEPLVIPSPKPKQ